MTKTEFESRKSYFLNNNNSFVRNAAEELNLSILKDDDTIKEKLEKLEFSLSDKSEGHLFFAEFEDFGKYEYFLRDGCIWRAPVSNVIMPDGYRCGRFEGYKSFLPQIKKNFISL